MSLYSMSLLVCHILLHSSSQSMSLYNQLVCHIQQSLLKFTLQPSHSPHLPFFFFTSPPPELSFVGDPVVGLEVRGCTRMRFVHAFAGQRFWLRRSPRKSRLVSKTESKPLQHDRWKKHPPQPEPILTCLAKCTIATSWS